MGTRKTIRKEWPRVRQYEKNGKNGSSTTYYLVDVRKTGYVGQKYYGFSDRAKALTFASERAELRNTDSKALGVTLTEDPRITAWTEQFSVYGKTVEQAMEVALKVFETCKTHGRYSTDIIETASTVFKREQQVKESPFMGELLTLWVLDKTENPLRKLSHDGERSIKAMSTTFKKDFDMARMKEIDQSTIEKYLKSKDVSNQTRKNLRNYLCQFFNWAVAKNHHDENPALKIKVHVEQKEVKFYTVAQCIDLMTEASKVENKSVVACFALGLFGGIRPKEVERMTWDNVKMDTKEIHLPASITKTKKPRLFKMTDNLHSWLSTCDKDQPLMPANLRKLKEKVTKAQKFDWVQDGLRHTFATFSYAKHKNLETLRHDMGNSPNVIEKFYKGAIPAAEVEKFWSISASITKAA